MAGPLTEEQVADFIAAMAAFYENNDESKLMELFRLIDQNGNNSLERNELKSIMSQI